MVCPITQGDHKYVKMSLQTFDRPPAKWLPYFKQNIEQQEQKVSLTCCSRVVPHCSDTSTKYKMAARK